MSEPADVTRRAVGSCAELVGDRASEVIWTEAGMASDLRQHPRTDLLAVMEGEDVVIEARSFQYSV
jgi:hypothetical protein